MEDLYGVQELAERWHCAERTARARMRKIGTIGKPMMCRESAIAAWERKTEQKPEPEIRQGTARRRSNVIQIQQGPLKPGQIISRVRPKETERRAT